jgi:hypothetical protein
MFRSEPSLRGVENVDLGETDESAEPLGRARVEVRSVDAIGVLGELDIPALELQPEPLLRQGASCTAAS